MTLKSCQWFLVIALGFAAIAPTPASVPSFKEQLANTLQTLAMDSASPEVSTSARFSLGHPDKVMPLLGLLKECPHTPSKVSQARRRFINASAKGPTTSLSALANLPALPVMQLFEAYGYLIANGHQAEAFELFKNWVRVEAKATNALIETSIAVMIAQSFRPDDRAIATLQNRVLSVKQFVSTPANEILGNTSLDRVSAAQSAKLLPLLRTELKRSSEIMAQLARYLASLK